jgi:hypothetical protein
MNEENARNDTGREETRRRRGKEMFAYLEDPRVLEVTDILKDHSVFICRVQQSQKRSCDDATKRRLLPLDTVSHITRLESL